jgi:hypothetical protein
LDRFGIGCCLLLKLVELLLHQAQLLFQSGNLRVTIASRLRMRLSRRSHNKQQRSANDTIEPDHHSFPSASIATSIDNRSDMASK